MSNPRTPETNLQTAAAIAIGHALVPVATLLAWKAQLAKAEHDALTIHRMGKILIDSETDLKSSKEESLHIGKQLTNCLRENLALQKEVIQTSNLLTDAHTKYAERLEGFASAIVGSRNRIIELEAEIAQLKKDLPKRD